MSATDKRVDSGAGSVAQYGYTQELERTLRRFASFAIGFSFISITTGIFTTYGSVLNSSGPLGIWTWPLVIVGQLCVALVFASLAARIPLAGYSYQWMSRLANPYIGWAIGWLAFTFLVVDVVAVDYALASTVAPKFFGYQGTEGNIWFATALVIALQGLLITTSTIWSERINNLAVVTEVLGVGGLTILLLVVGAVLGHLHWSHLFSRGTVAGASSYFVGSGFHASPWALGFLLGAFTIVGFEACGNLAEETETPEKVVPRAMWSAVLLSGIIGFAFLIAITAASGDITALTKSGTPVADVVRNVLGPVVGDLLLLLVMFSIFACGLVIYITASRVTWAMSRDKRFPGYQVFRKVSPRFRTPFAAALMIGILTEVVLAAFATRTGALFNLFSAATFLPALIYLATVILYIATRRRLPKEKVFHLGAWEGPVLIIAVVWLLYELSIFRDSSFAGPWIYTLVMMGIGLVYFLFMLASGRSLDMPHSQSVPMAEGTSAGRERAE